MKSRPFLALFVFLAGCAESVEPSFPQDDGRSGEDDPFATLPVLLVEEDVSENDTWAGVGMDQAITGPVELPRTNASITPPATDIRFAVEQKGVATGVRLGYRVDGEERWLASNERVVPIGGRYEDRPGLRWTFLWSPGSAAGHTGVSTDYTPVDTQVLVRVTAE